MTECDNFSGVAVTGYDCACAAGSDAQSATDGILAGIRNYSFDKGVTKSQGKTFPVFPLEDEWLPAGYFDLPESMRCGEIALKTVRSALNHASLSEADLKRSTVGVCIGTTAGNSLNNDPFYGDYLAGKNPSAKVMLDYRRANPAAYVADALGVNGPCQTVTNACSSGVVAIGEAMGWIRSGLCDVVIAGGAEKLCPVLCHGFASLFIADSSPCRPFDASRNGLNLGEGAGIMILESEESRRRRGAKPAGTLMGYGNRSDAYHLSAPDPQGGGLRAAIDEALRTAGRSLGQMAFINAHGTATQENDAMESSVFAETAPDIPFFSVKGCTGHTLGAAGAIEAVLTMVFLERQTIPASVGFESGGPDKGVAPTRVVTPINGDYALTDSIAFGGNCGVLVIKRGGDE